MGIILTYLGIEHKYISTLPMISIIFYGLDLKLKKGFSFYISDQKSISLRFSIRCLDIRSGYDIFH